MKRKREIENSGSEIRSAIDELSKIVVLKVKPSVVGADDEAEAEAEAATASAVILTKSFLSICNLLLQVLDKIGPSMAVLRQDINQNIQRLDFFYQTDPKIYSNVVEIVKKEASEGKAKRGPSSSKALVWLTRSLDFTVSLLELLLEDFARDMKQAVDASYNITLKPWHGWVSSAAYNVAIKLVPDSHNLIDILMAKDEEHEMLKMELHTLISLFTPVLEELHNIMKTYGLDRLKCT